LTLVNFPGFYPDFLQLMDFDPVRNAHEVE
jgi:hypothetical protein